MYTKSGPLRSLADARILFAVALNSLGNKKRSQRIQGGSE